MSFKNNLLRKTNPILSTQVPSISKSEKVNCLHYRYMFINIGCKILNLIFFFKKGIVFKEKSCATYPLFIQFKQLFRYFG